MTEQVITACSLVLAISCVHKSEKQRRDLVMLFWGIALCLYRAWHIAAMFRHATRYQPQYSTIYYNTRSWSCINLAMSLRTHKTILADNFYYKPGNNLREKWESVMPTTTTLAVLVMLTRKDFWLANLSCRKFASSFTIKTLNRSFQIRCTTVESQNLSTVITQCMKNNIFVQSGITSWWPCEKFR